MSTTFFGAVFDATDAARAAAFWSDVLGRPVNDGATAQDAAIDATTPELGPRLAFHRVPEAKTAKNRFHPDLITSDLESETSRLLSLGAKGRQRVEHRNGTVDHIHRSGRQRVRSHRRLSPMTTTARHEHVPSAGPASALGKVDRWVS